MNWMAAYIDYIGKIGKNSNKIHAFHYEQHSGTNLHANENYTKKIAVTAQQSLYTIYMFYFLISMSHLTSKII